MIARTPRRLSGRALRALGCCALAAGLASASACGRGEETARPPGKAKLPKPVVAFRTAAQLSPAENAFLDTLEVRTFRFFWDLSHPRTGLTPDRAPSRSFASVSATGFALTAYAIGAERGWVTRGAAFRRVRDTLRFAWRAPQNDSAAGAMGYRGMYYHFVHPETGLRFEKVELSTVDTALFLAGALTCQTYFDGADPEETEIRALAESLFARADWRWAQVRPPAIGHGWDPEQGHLPYDWRGYNEAMLLYILALGSTTHPVGADAWAEWASRYRWGTFQAQEHLGFAPLFGHQYTHVWIDLRGIRDAAMRDRGMDYFENSRRATLAQYAYALENPGGWQGYGPRLWGLTACDGPLDGTLEIDGRKREFHTYWARGASFTEIQDDGTVAPTAAGGSIAFAPDLVLGTLMALREDHGERIFGKYGFLDALNPTLRVPASTYHGRIDPEHGWFDTDYLGIDQGPILAMAANFRRDFVWGLMRRNAHVVRGLRAAGFTGGWLDTTGEPR